MCVEKKLVWLCLLRDGGEVLNSQTAKSGHLQWRVRNLRVGKGDFGDRGFAINLAKKIKTVSFPNQSDAWSFQVCWNMKNTIIFPQAIKPLWIPKAVLILFLPEYSVRTIPE